MDTPIHPQAEAVCEANLALKTHGLVTLTWGNASVVDRANDVFLIKPSGVSYTDLTAAAMATVSLEDGSQTSGAFRPSSDTATHRHLYRHFPECGAIVHTHSEWASSWAQARRAIPCLGTTHADHFYGDIPLCRDLTDDELLENYEENTGKSIVDAFTDGGADPVRQPGVLVPGHGVFTWGRTLTEAVENAVAVEAIARMAANTLTLAPDTPPLHQSLLDKHFLRKHGPNASYGQR